MRRFAPLLIIAVFAIAYGVYRLYVARQPFEWSGTVEARTVAVASRTGGRVKDVLVREGDHVKAGQPLVILEANDLEAQKLVAEGQLEQAKAQLDKLERGNRPEEIAQARARAQSAKAAFAETRAGARKEQIEAAQARLRAAQATAGEARRVAERQRALLARGAATRVEVDQANTALETAVAQRDGAQKAYDELKNGTRAEEVVQAAARSQEADASARLAVAGSRSEDVRAARGAVSAAQGRLDQVAVSIAELTVRAPRDARVEALDLRPGDVLAPNAPAATLLEDAQLYLRIYVPETQLAHVKVGQDVRVSVDGFDRTFAARVEHINGIGEYSPRNLQTADERADQVFAMRVVLQEGHDVVKAGMAAFVKVPK
ncbi:MAG TPA: HlyD family efflux transporter periplasmic adaptor subunit [Polyangia bacterium]|nr:HlyD family efflux transporter periplasmic adaptor subunit [Polyangia bacterium]